MGRVLMVGLDGSAGGEAALRHAIAEARVSGARLHLAAIIALSVADLSADMDAGRAESIVDTARQRVHEIVLEPALARCREAGIEADGEVCSGNPAERLAVLAEQRKVDAIIVGRRGLSRLKALVFGSTASNLVQLAPVPVTVVPVH